MNKNLNHVTQAIRSGAPRPPREPRKPVTVEAQALPETDVEHELCWNQPQPVRAAITALLATNHPEAFERAQRLAEYVRLQQEAQPAIVDFSQLTAEELAKVDAQLKEFRGRGIEPTFTPAETTIDRDELVAICRLITEMLGKHDPNAAPVTFENVRGHVADLIDSFEHVSDRATKAHAELRQLSQRDSAVAEASIPFSVLRKAAAEWMGLEDTAGPEWPMEAIGAHIRSLHSGIEAQAVQLERLANLHSNGTEETDVNASPFAKTHAKLTQILARLEANQKPEGYEQAVQTLLANQKRYDSMLTIIEQALQLK